MTTDPHYTDADRFWVPDMQGYAIVQERQRHIDALYHFGEYAMFVLLWRPSDYEAGAVGRCEVCFTSYGKVAEVYQQPATNECLSCYGTTFQGGYRAKIVRPSMWDVSEPTQAYRERGEVTRNNASIQTTHDFRLHIGDYIFRADGTRWRVETLSTNHLQTGFHLSTTERDVLGWNFGQVMQMDESTVAYQITPTPDELRTALDLLQSRAPTDFTALEHVVGALL